MCACALVAVAGKAEDVEAILPDAVNLAAGTGSAAPNWGSCSITCGGEGKLKCTYEGYCPRCKCSPSISCFMGSNC